MLDIVDSLSDRSSGKITSETGKLNDFVATNISKPKSYSTDLI